MTTYVALLRGINVGRAKRVGMAELRGLLADLGYTDVQSLLNSGNLIFDARTAKPAAIAKKIETALPVRLGVVARVLVQPGEAFARIVAQDELARRGDPARLLVAFCEDPSRLRELAPLKRQDWHPEALAVERDAALLWCADGILESRLLKMISRQLGDGLTTRNWTTVMKIHAALAGRTSGDAKPANKAKSRA